MRWSTCGLVRKHILLLPLCHLILRKLLQAVINACKIQRFEGLFRFCLLGFVLDLMFFTVKQRKRGTKALFAVCLGDQKGSCCGHGWSPFLPVRILLCTLDTGLPMQLRGSMDWGLQLIFLIGGLVRTRGTVGNKESTSTFGCDLSRNTKQLGFFIAGFLPRLWEMMEVS